MGGGRAQEDLRGVNPVSAEDEAMKPSAKSTEVYTKYIMVDMYAKACQGMKAEDAVKWAEGELKKIYEA